MMNIQKYIVGILTLAALMLAAPTAHAQDITSGLVGHWKMDETSGAVVVDSGPLGNNGIYENGLDPALRGTGGAIGNALQVIWNNNHRASVAASSDYALAEFTMTGWVKLRVSSGYNGFLQLNGLGTLIFNFGTTELRFYPQAWTGNGRWQKSNAATVGEWVHIAMAYNYNDSINTPPTLYLNGALVSWDSTAASSGTFTAPATAAVNIGNVNFSGYRMLEGTIDDARIYNRTLSAADVAVLASGTTLGGMRYNTESEAVEYHSGKEWVHTGTGSYSPNAVEFNGTNTRVTMGSGNRLDGVTTGKKGAISFWFKADAVGNNLHTLFYEPSAAIQGTFVSDEVRISAWDATNSRSILDLRTTGLNGDTTTWHHVMASWDLSDVAKRHLYLDGVADMTVNNWIDFPIDYDGPNFTIGARTNSTQWYDGAMADFWFDMDDYIDLSVQANREKFLSANNMPMYLGVNGSLVTGAAPDIFVSGDTATWHTNKGTGGGFTENGALTDALTDPAEPLPVWAQIGNNYFPPPGAEKAITTLTDTTIAYIDDNFDNLTTYSWDGTDWSLVGNTLNIPGLNNMGIAALDSETIALVDGTTNILETYSWDGTDWTQIGNTFTLSGGAAISRLDQNTIALTHSSPDTLRTYSWDGTDWSLVGNALSIPIDRSTITSLDSTTVVVSEITNNNITTYSWDGTDWTQTGNALNISGAGRPGITTLNSTTILHSDATNTALKTYSWDGTDWTQIGATSVTGGAGHPYYTALGPNTVVQTTVLTDQIRTYRYAFCTNPSEPAGSIIYNAGSKVMQYCNGVDWVAMGPIGGSGGSGCTSPTGVAGDLVFNERYNVLQYCNAEDWVPMGKSGYFANAVEFENGVPDRLSGGALTGTSDGTQITGSFWINYRSTGSHQLITALWPNDVTVRVLSTSALSFTAHNTSDTTVLDITTNAGTISSGWNHVLYSFDLSDTGKRHAYINDVDQSLNINTYNTGGTIDFTPTSMEISNAAVPLGSDLADVWLKIGTYMDLSVASNRAKFINGAGKPVDLGADGSTPTGSAADIFLSGDTATWHTNDGTGGGFTENGAITDAATTPN